MPEGLELIPLCAVTMQVGEPIAVTGSPRGDLLIGEIVSARWEGERFKANLRGRAAADWLRLGEGGTGVPDVRLSLETDDGALVYVSYSGRYDAEAGVAYTTPAFLTGDARYTWMNSIQAVGKATFDAAAAVVHYPMIYELR